MGYPETDSDYYEAIIDRQIRSGRAGSKSEVIHQALQLLDSLTRGSGPAQTTFEGPEDLMRLLKTGLDSGPARPMTEKRWAKICGRKRV